MHPNASKPIQNRSTYQIGDLFIHKKHRFIVRIKSRGEWSSQRVVEVLKGDVPKVVQQRVQGFTAPGSYEGHSWNAEMTYTTCALGLCFERLKAGQVLFG